MSTSDTIGVWRASAGLRGDQRLMCLTRKKRVQTRDGWSRVEVRDFLTRDQAMRACERFAGPEADLKWEERFIDTTATVDNVVYRVYRFTLPPGGR